jgi:hypothetical protein
MASRLKHTNDLFTTTLHELHYEAPIELLNSLRSQLSQIKSTNPNSAQTAEACLDGLASDRSTLLHVLTAAYLINGGVMIKLQAVNEEEKLESKPGCSTTSALGDKLDISNEFDSLEEELNNFSITINGDLKPKTGLLSALPPPTQSPGAARDLLERF